jgi:hypothetical protein
LYELANKHRSTKLDDNKAYKMPDAYDNDSDQDGRERKMKLLNKRYKKEDGNGADE